MIIGIGMRLGITQWETTGVDKDRKMFDESLLAYAGTDTYCGSTVFVLIALSSIC